MKTDDHVPELTPNLARLAAKLLHVANEEFANHGCNDFELWKVSGYETREERAALDLAYCTWNGDPREHDPEEDHRYSTDFALMSFLAAVLEKAAGTPPKKSADEKRTVKIQNATSAASDATEGAGSAMRELADARQRAMDALAKCRAQLSHLEALLR